MEKLKDIASKNNVPFWIIQYIKIHLFKGKDIYFIHKKYPQVPINVIARVRDWYGFQYPKNIKLTLKQGKYFDLESDIENQLNPKYLVDELKGEERMILDKLKWHWRVKNINK